MKKGKYDHARQLLSKGLSNKVIISQCREMYGSGVSTTMLAQWRQALNKQRKQRRRRGQPRETKKKILREVLEAGGSAYAAQKRLKEVTGSGCGYDLVLEVKSELGLTPRAPGSHLPSPQHQGSGLLRTDARDVDENPVPQCPPKPTLEEALVHFEAIQTWMGQVNAESLTFASNGQLDVVVKVSSNDAPSTMAVTLQAENAASLVAAGSLLSSSFKGD